VFIKEQQKPSASVILSLQGGRLLDSAQVSAIVHLISSSVPELSAKNVTVVDQNGTLLSASHDGTSNEGLDANQLKYVQQIEQSFVERIDALLVPLLGPNNVHAQVSADIDFSRIEQTSETFKPNQNPTVQAIRSQQTSQSNSNSGSGGGIPGALTNQPPVPATAPIVANKGVVASTASAGPSSQQKESTVNYEVDRTISHTVLPVGSIKRLSVAVVVNGNRKITDAKGKVTLKPLSDAEKEQINNLVRDAMGFDQKRGDSLNVQVAAFAENKETVEEIPFWKQPYVIELAKDIIKYLLIAAAIGFIVFRVITPAFRTLLTALNNMGSLKPQTTPAAASFGQMSAANVPYEQNLQVARQIAQQEPKVVASVIKEWVKE
jgi:flagellar M-ring protein FliF